MEGPPLGPGGEDITWPDQVAPQGRKASSTRKIKPQISNLIYTHEKLNFTHMKKYNEIYGIELHQSHDTQQIFPSGNSGISGAAAMPVSNLRHTNPLKEYLQKNFKSDLAFVRSVNDPCSNQS